MARGHRAYLVRNVAVKGHVNSVGLVVLQNLRGSVNGPLVLATTKDELTAFVERGEDHDERSK